MRRGQMSCCATSVLILITTGGPLSTEMDVNEVLNRGMASYHQSIPGVLSQAGFDLQRAQAV
jgi:hypothetical protein